MCQGVILRGMEVGRALVASVVLAAISAVCIGVALRWEEKLLLSSPARFDYHLSPGGFFRECAQWDPTHGRFLVSFMEGGLGEVAIGGKEGEAVQERVVVKDPELRGKSTLGFKVDPARHRVVAAVADILWLRYSALVAYDTRTWERLFLVQLAGSERISMADDVALDPDGNAYVTDMKGNLIWKVNPSGTNVSVLTASPVFSSYPNKLPFNLVGLNGIAYHPDGFLLVVHTWSGALFKVLLDGTTSVSRVKLDADLFAGDGIALVTPEKLAIASARGVKLVESGDGWERGHVTHAYSGPIHRVSSAITIKDGHVFASFLNGFSLFRPASTIAEVLFSPI